MISQRKKQKSFTLSTLITLFIVAMLVISGPAQAVQVSIDTNNINGRTVGETAFFYVNITIGANERIPIANISVVGLPDIPGSPDGLLVFNVSDFDSVGAYVIKDNYNITLIDRHGWVDGYGYGYGYNNNSESAPYYGYGYGYRFYGYGYGYGYDYGYGYGYSNGYGYGYGYGYGNPDTYTRLNYKITVDTTGANAQAYDVIAKVNTGRGVLFQKSESFRLIENITDNTPPASVTDLHNITYARTYINWTWIDPADADLANVSVWIDGTFKDNVPKGVQFYNATGFAPDTEHTIATRTVDTSGNTNETWVTRTDRTAPTPQASPIQVTIEISPETINLNNNGVITISVLNNTPAGFDVADINVSTVRFAGAIAFSNNIAANKLILKFNTKDTNIQCGDTQATLTGETYSGQNIIGSDSFETVGCGGGITPPNSITNLHNISYTRTYINWTWIDPADADLANVSVWIDGTFKDKVPKGIQSYNATGFAPDTEHTIATRTADTSGNTNETWVNRTARTAPAILPPPVPVRIRINPDHINPKSKGEIKVTVFNNTPPGFDVGSINISTVRFGPGGAKVIKNKTIPPHHSDDRDLFRWDNIPGNDNEKLMEFLKEDFDIEWVSTAKIEKIDDDRTIRVSKERNSLTLELNDEKTVVNLIIDDIETDEFTTEMEDGKLKVHDHKKLVLHFNTEDAGIQCGDTQENLTGKTYSGQDIIGSDNIKTVRCGGGHRDGGSGGGGGGGGMGSGEPYDNIIEHEERDGDLLANHPVTFRFSKAGHRISEIGITGKESENHVSVRVEALKDKSRLVPEPISGAIYMNIIVSTKKIKEARINFKLDNTWIASSGIPSDDISLYRWNGSKWDQLKTTEIANDGFYTNYSALTPGFSSFAIGGRRIEKAEQLEAIPLMQITSTVTEIPEAAESPSVEAPPMNLAVIIGFVGLIAAVAYVYIKRKDIFK